MPHARKASANFVATFMGIAYPSAMARPSVQVARLALQTAALCQLAPRGCGNGAIGHRCGRARATKSWSFLPRGPHGTCGAEEPATPRRVLDDPAAGGEWTDRYGEHRQRDSLGSLQCSARRRRQGPWSREHVAGAGVPGAPRVYPWRRSGGAREHGRCRHLRRRLCRRRSPRARRARSARREHSRCHRQYGPRREGCASRSEHRARRLRRPRGRAARSAACRRRLEATRGCATTALRRPRPPAVSCSVARRRFRRRRRPTRSMRSSRPPKASSRCTASSACTWTTRSVASAGTRSTPQRRSASTAVRSSGGPARARSSRRRLTHPATSFARRKTTTRESEREA